MRVVPGIDISNGHVLSTSALEPHLARASFGMLVGGGGTLIVTDVPHPEKVLAWDKTQASSVGDLRYVAGLLWRVYQCRKAVAANTDTRPDRDPESWNDAGPYEIVWSQGAHAATDRVIRRETHRTYYALRSIGADEATAPEDDPETWQDIGPTNAWAMFDKYRSSPSYAPLGTTYEGDMIIPNAPLEPGVIEVHLQPRKRVDSIMFGGLDGTELTVEMVHVDPATSVVTSLMTRRVKLLRRTVTNWKEYFFGQFKPRRSVAIFGLPLRANARIIIRITNTVGPAKCGAVLVDRSVWAGNFKYDTTTDADNYSEIERDKYGDAKLTPYRTVNKVIGTLQGPARLSNVYLELRDSLNARPAGFVGLENHPNHAFYDSLFVIGLMRRLTDRKAGATHVTADIEIEEL